MGVNAGAYAPVGNFLIPRAPGARRYFWRRLYAHPRRGWLARWRPRPACAPAWTAWCDDQLRAWLGPRCVCVWRAAAPGVSRAMLGWVLDGSRLVAMARAAEGANIAFLNRHRQALDRLGRLPALAASTPRLLAVAEERKPERLLLLESVLPGTPRPPWRGALETSLPAAAWLAEFQRWALPAPGGDALEHNSTCRSSPENWWGGPPARSLAGYGISRSALAAWRSTLAGALAAHAGLNHDARDLALRALDQVPVPALVNAHGDFWWANVLIEPGGGAARVVDWSEFRPVEHPWHDAGFFLLTLARDALGGGRTPPARWLSAAFHPGANVRSFAERWLAAYTIAGGAAVSLETLLAYLPVVMARYACFGQQAAHWTAALNAWPQAAPR